MDYLSVAVNLFSFSYTDDMAENSAVCIQHIILCHSGLKSQGTE